MKNSQFQKLIERVSKETSAIDLSKEEDLSIAVMNLLSIEEHLFFTASKTKNQAYLDFLDQVREMRKKLLAKLLPKHEGETWCLAKHLLAGTMRLMEVGAKAHADGKKEEASEIYQYAYTLYSIFFGIRLKLIEVGDVRTHAKQQTPWTLQDIVEKLVDCCDE